MQDDIAPPQAPPAAGPPARRWHLSPAIYAGMFLLTLVLWLPFSFKTTGLIEEWSIVHVIESGSPPFFITSHSTLSHARLRPFLAFVHSVAHALDPDSFLFFNVFALLFMFGKMVAVYWLVLQFLPQRRLLAFVSGVLFVVYPADTALFTFRAIQIHAAVCSFLFAAYLLIRFVRRPHRAGWLYLTGATVLLLFSLMTYQIALPLAMLTPLTALAFVRVSDRRLWIASAAWYGAITVLALYAAWAVQQGGRSPYEIDLLAAKTACPLSPLADTMGAIGLAYERQATGWVTAWQGLSQYPQLRMAVLAALAVFAATGAWIARDERRDPESRVSTRRLVIVGVVAAAIVVLGMAAFLALPTHRRDDFRIYLLSMAGSALVLALLLFWISRGIRRFREVAFLTLAVPFVGLGYTYALQNHQYYVNYSLEQQQVLQDVVAEAPRLSPRSFVVFLDQTGIMDKPYVFYSGFYLGAGLQYLYADPSIDAGYCPLASPGAFGTHCTFDTASIHITRASGIPGDTTVPYDRVLILTNDVDDHFRLLTPGKLAATHDVTGYNPQLRIADAPPPRRAATMFSCEPALSCYRESTASATSFDLPEAGPIGRGWRGPEPDGAGGTFRWSVTLTPTVSVKVTNDADLALEFRIVGWLDPAVVESLTLSVSGTAIPLMYEPLQPFGRVYHGVLPREILVRSGSRTQLTFHTSRMAPVPTVPDVKLGIALGSLQIRPRSGAR